MNITELNEVVRSLHGLSGMWFDGAWQPRRDRVVLGLRAPGTRACVLLVPRGPWARIHTIDRRPPNPKSPFSFQGALRAHLHGRLQGLAVVPGERAVDLHFADETRLHLRLTGMSGGLWLCRGDEVLAAFDGPAPEALPAFASHTPREDASRLEGTDADQAARLFFTSREQAARRRQRQQVLRQRMRKAHAKQRRLVVALEKDLAAAGDAPALRRKADALAAVLYRVPAHVPEIQVADLEEAEKTWTIRLEPGRPAHQTMDKLYQRARRLERGATRIRGRLEVAREELQVLEGLRKSLAGEADDELLAMVAATLPAPQQAPSARSARRPWKIWRREDGREAWIGTNARCNHLLTFHAARGWDWWLHIRERPGPHVILPGPKEWNPPLSLLIEAAQLGLFSGRVLAGELVDVQYTRVKHLRTVPGEVGRAQVLDERVLAVTAPNGAPEGWRLIR